MLNRLGGMTKKQLVDLADSIREHNRLAKFNGENASLSINSPRWPASAHRRTRDSNASVGVITSPGDAALTEAQSQPNESVHMKKPQIPRCNLGPRFDS